MYRPLEEMQRKAWADPIGDDGDAFEDTRARIVAFINAHLDNVELDATMLQDEFRISRTQLYGLFSDCGGIQILIGEKRLVAAFGDLCSDCRQRIIDVVYRRGFSCQRQFQRMFRSRFGVTPSALAAAAQSIQRMS